VTYIFFEIIL